VIDAVYIRLEGSIGYRGLGKRPGATAVTDEPTDGSQSESDQAIEVRYTVSPDGGTINNMTVDFDGTDQTFIESNSLPPRVDTSHDADDPDQ